MGIGYWLSFLTKYNVTAGIISAKASIGIINRLGVTNSQGNSGTTANTAIESFSN
jgi:hypothetical protein